MSVKLYVGNLPYSTTDEDLKQAFAQAGEVTEAAVIMEKMTGRSRGFGFVTMADQAGADKAVETFNGKDFDGRVLVVNEARPLQPRAPRAGGNDFGGGQF
ncbi:MAG TPA: RNA-binding protein [Candidatus Paceibacterota bacterium]|nr:RNA-binding protein [Candidatus Paceibacterota bacterium]